MLPEGTDKEMRRKQAEQDEILHEAQNAFRVIDAVDAIFQFLHAIFLQDRIPAELIQISREEVEVAEVTLAVAVSCPN